MKPQKYAGKPITIDPSTIPPLPADIMSDLTDAFNYYDKTNSGFISLQQFKSILHNFGFHRTTKKDMDEELRRHEIDLAKRFTFDFETTKNVIAWRLTKGGGREEEAKDCYKLFDKREKSYINVHDIKSQVGKYLEFPVTDNEISELIEFADQSNMGQINMRDFTKFYNS